MDDPKYGECQIPLASLPDTSAFELRGTLFVFGKG
jgi:hypothetical protein